MTTMEMTTTIGTHPSGDKILAMTRVCPDNAPPAVRAAVAARTEANATGQCPLCNVRMQMPKRHERRKAAATGEPIHVTMRHEDNCPCSDEGLLRSSVSGTN